MDRIVDQRQLNCCLVLVESRFGSMVSLLSYLTLIGNSLETRVCFRWGKGFATSRTSINIRLVAKIKNLILVVIEFCLNYRILVLYRAVFQTPYSAVLRSIQLGPWTNIFSHYRLCIAAYVTE